MSVDTISDCELVGRAVRSARDPHYNGVKHPRWVAVKYVFCLGSGYSMELCRRYGLNPDENVIVESTQDGDEP